MEPVWEHQLMSSSAARMRCSGADEHPATVSLLSTYDWV